MRLGTCLHGRHVAIDAGGFSGTYQAARGEPDVFVVVLVEPDGSHAMLWDGSSRLDAIRVASAMAFHRGVPVLDM